MELTPLTVRTYGDAGPWVVLVHGGPGAPGYLESLARDLAGSFRVLEPFQRASGDEPLSVDRHVDDLEGVLRDRCGAAPAAIVGHSWGAMLALAHGAAYPDGPRPRVLIGCGTFDLESRALLVTRRQGRMTEALRCRESQILEEVADPDERLRLLGELSMVTDSFDVHVTPGTLFLRDSASSRDTAAGDITSCDARAHEESWQDMVRCQESGRYPDAFRAIQEPVLMLHGEDDPHPGRSIRDGLLPYLPQLEYRDWDRCGHYPWLEPAAAVDFRRTLETWLLQRLGATEE